MIERLCVRWRRHCTDLLQHRKQVELRPVFGQLPLDDAAEVDASERDERRSRCRAGDCARAGFAEPG